MCTAVSFISGCHYFGRTLDLEYNYNECVAVTPRHFSLDFRHLPALEEHYAIIGIATVADGHALYYDGANEKGLAMAALNFPVSARYYPPTEGHVNVAAFELIPWVLGQCSDLVQAAELLEGVNVTDTYFGPDYPSTPLHWMIADRKGSLVAEPTEVGLRVRKNPVRLLTNEPPFDTQLHNLSNYVGLSADPPEVRFVPGFEPTVYSRGMGAMGLPGDFSSASRFVRGAFALHNSVCEQTEESSVSQFFRIMDTVSQPRGCVKVGDGYVQTVYTSCCNTDAGIYYYSTYENRGVCCVDMHRCDLDGSALSVFPMLTEAEFRTLN